MKGLLSFATLALGLSAASASVVNTVSEFRDGAAFAPEGYGLIRNWYQAEGRLTARYSTYGGMTHLSYWGPKGNYAISFGEDSAHYARNYDPQVLIDGRPYRLTFTNTLHYTFGYSSECTILDVKLRHEFVLDKHTAYRRITVLENPSNRRVRARIHQMNVKRLLTHDHARGVLRGAAVRRGERGQTVTNRVEVGCLTGKVTFPINVLRTRQACAKPARCTNAAGEQDDRFLMDTVEPSAVTVFYFDIDAGTEDAPSVAAIDRAYADYAAKYADSAKIVTADRLTGDFLTWGAAWADALDAGGEGAVRASQTYWVWPWDEMFSADVLALMGREETVRKMLLHLRDHASPETFLPGCYDSRFTANLKDTAVDWVGLDRTAKRVDTWNLMYLHLLYRYWLYTGDEETKNACLPFARAMLRCYRAHIDTARTHLPYGHFRPDFPTTLDWLPGERSASDAGIYYQALRTYAELTGEDLTDEIAAVKRETETLFFDRETGYWMDTVTEPAGTRKANPIRAVWGPWQISAFARELVPAEAPRIAAYMKRRFNRGAYLSFHDFDDPGWFADGNQLGAYCPPEDLYYWDQHNRANALGALADFRRILRPHAEIATFPEGQTADVENADPHVCSDNTGIKQFFSIKAWLVDTFNLRLGWDADRTGVRFHPMSDGVPFAVEDIHLRGARLTVRLSGKGTAKDARYVLDGRPLAEPLVPWSVLAKGSRHTLEITFGVPAKVVSTTGEVRLEEGLITYEHTADERAAGRFSLLLDFPAWEPDTWVFMPSCAYNGNRDATRVFFDSYPPHVSKRSSGLEPVLEQSQIPALEPDGSGALEVTSGDMAVPCAGFFFPKARRGVLVFTEQEVGGRNLGFTVRAGSLRVDYPANRTEGYRFVSKATPNPDKPLALAKGTRLQSRLRLLEFPADDVSALLERFFRERKGLLPGEHAPNGYTKELWAATEKAWNECCWIDGAYRQEIHKWVPGWTSGPNCVYPLYRFGGEQTRARCRQTLDFMMRHQSKYGFFYGRVVKDENVVDEPKCGPWDEPNRHLIRRSADALYFLIRCGRQMGWTDAWKAGARRCADAFVRTWRRYGQFGQWVDVEDGRILVGRSTSCAIAPAALYEAWKEFGDEAYREVALAACADYCRRDLDRGVTYGGPGDIILAPDSESAFSLLESCVVLAEETKDPQWLRRARQAAALCSTWVVSYCYRFPETCTFAKLGVNTVGAVFASVQNKHAAPGICTASGDSLLRLYRLTGDAAYLELCKDIAFFLPQAVSRADRPIVANDGRTLPPGFVSERVNMSDWEGPHRVGETFCAFCWCGTSLLTTWADLIGQPEFK